MVCQQIPLMIPDPLINAETRQELHVILVISFLLTSLICMFSHDPRSSFSQYFPSAVSFVLFLLVIQTRPVFTACTASWVVWQRFSARVASNNHVTARWWLQAGSSLGGKGQNLISLTVHSSISLYTEWPLMACCQSSLQCANSLHYGQVRVMMTDIISSCWTTT